MICYGFSNVSHYNILLLFTVRTLVNRNVSQFIVNLILGSLQSFYKNFEGNFDLATLSLRPLKIILTDLGESISVKFKTTSQIIQNKLVKKTYQMD